MTDMNNIPFGFNEETSEESGQKFIQVTPETAIDTGRYIQDVRKVSEDGSKPPYLIIDVVDKQGLTVSGYFFKPEMGKGFIAEGDAETLKNQINKINRVFKNLTTRFQDENFEIESETWDNYLDQVIDAVKKSPNWQNKELRVKVVLNNKGYPTLPSSAPIFEDASVPIEESKLRIRKGQYGDKVEVPMPDSDTSSSGGQTLEDDVKLNF